MKHSQASFKLMGTRIDFQVWHEDPEMLIEQVEHLLYLYQDRFSAHDLTSSLTEVNLNAGVQPVVVEADVYDLIAIGKEQSCAPGSFLNIALGPLVSTWRIGFADARLPGKEELAELLTLTNPADIQLFPDTREVYLTKKGMALDLGALAKGYIADRIVEHVQLLGAQAGFLNLGGNVRTFGQQPIAQNGCWRIGIQDPQLPRGQYVAILEIEAGSVVTSGVYERQLVADGQTYHHILDRQTGYPVQSPIASLTIVSEASLDGEIWTTRLFGLSADEIETALAKEEGLEAIIISRDGEVRVTAGLPGRLLRPQEVVDTHSAAFRNQSLDDVVADTRSGASLL